VALKELDELENNDATAAFAALYAAEEIELKAETALTSGETHESSRKKMLKEQAR